jgi:hypothetical protein
MNGTPIHFQFGQTESARLALDTLKELGYDASLQQRSAASVIHVVLNQSDLTSALEIAQAYGGMLTEGEDEAPEAETFNQAYSLVDGPTIPAHVVNEDWPESYAAEEQTGSDASMSAGSDPEAEFDPSGDDYDHFPAGIRL